MRMWTAQPRTWVVRVAAPATKRAASAARCCAEVREAGDGEWEWEREGERGRGRGMGGKSAVSRRRRRRDVFPRDAPATMSVYEGGMSSRGGGTTGWAASAAAEEEEEEEVDIWILAGRNGESEGERAKEKEKEKEKERASTEEGDVAVPGISRKVGVGSSGGSLSLLPRSRRRRQWLSVCGAGARR